MAPTSASTLRTWLLRAKPAGVSVVAGTWVWGLWSTIILLAAVYFGVPLCGLILRHLALPVVRGAGRAIELGIEGSIERFFARRHAQADQNLMPDGMGKKHDGSGRCPNLSRIGNVAIRSSRMARSRSTLDRR